VPRGRPTALTEEVGRAIVEAVARGVSLSAAAGAVGIAPQSVREWVQVGEGRHPEREAKEPYISFAVEVRKAKAAAEAERVALLRRLGAGRAVVKREPVRNPDGSIARDVDGSVLWMEHYAPPDFRALSFWLERQSRDEWGKSHRTEITGPDGGPVQLIAASLNDPTARSAAAELARAIGRSRRPIAELESGEAQED